MDHGADGRDDGTDSGADDDDGDGIVDGGPGDLASLTMALDEEFPSVIDVSLTTDRPGEAWLTYGLDGVMDQSTPRWTVDEALDTSVLGLKAARRYTVQAHVETADGDVLDSGVWKLTMGRRDGVLPAFDQTVDDPARQEGGFLLVTLMQADRSWIVALDHDGDYVWWHNAGEGRVVPTVKVSADGASVLYGSYDNGQLEDLGEVVRQPIAGGEQVRTRTVMAHHDFFEGPDGLIYWLAYENRDVDIDGVATTFTGDVVLRIHEGADDDASPTLVWDPFTVLPEPSISCSHVEEVMPSTRGHDWTHGNSLIYDPDSDGFVYVPRHLDRVMFVDRGRGELRWVLGADGTLDPAEGQEDVVVDGEPLVDHPHLSVGDEGMVAVFDNGDHRDPQASSVSVFEIDAGSQTWERTFHYTDPEGRFVPILGDIVDLPDGDWLTSWTNSGLIVELSPDGQVVRQLEAAVGTGTGRIVWVSDLYDLSAD
ncbi:MAG: aryl-sulfate sulfotransferase [Alphaproteobacteria bacterium]|nr:aryl-sulfate sulfotransferase [Alphaproteobacteria bacterium]